jgi:hypothetical protein
LGADLRAAGLDLRVADLRPAVGFEAAGLAFAFAFAFGGRGFGVRSGTRST